VQLLLELHSTDAHFAIPALTCSCFAMSWTHICCLEVKLWLWPGWEWVVSMTLQKLLYPQEKQLQCTFDTGWVILRAVLDVIVKRKSTVHVRNWTLVI
jgi:hypothetical protein